MALKAKPQIILTDDDADDRVIFSDAFGQLKIDSELTMFEDGIQLLDYLRRVRQIPKMLFLDLNMPKKNGIDCLREIRAEEKFNKLAIAIYSTSSSPRDIEESFVNGATLYIKKPSDFQNLKSLIRDVVFRNLQPLKTPYNKETFLVGY